MGAQSLTGSRSFVEATRNSSQWRMLKEEEEEEEGRGSRSRSRAGGRSRSRPRQVFDEGFVWIEEEAGSSTFRQQCLLHVQPEAGCRIQGGIPADGSRQGRHP